jgi:Nif-specific regulatory protein
MQNVDQKILELTALYEISKALTSSLDLKVTSHKIMEILTTVLGMQRGTLTLLNPETGELAIEVAYGLSKEQQARGRFKIGEGITGRVFKTGEPMIIPDIGKEPLFLNRTKSRGDISRQNIAFLCIPVKVHGETIGVLSVDRIFAEAGISFEEDLRVLAIVASLIGQAVKLTQIVEDEKRSLIQENIHLQQELKAKYRLANIVGVSKRMVEVYEAVERVSGTKATVLLRGESGTGKELIARAIHYSSPRSTGPFIKLNCAALPETLLESELFGHEKGAFTGATQTRQGRFELAHGGTLFLDEIGDVPLTIQVKLLRVLQETRFERVGGDRTIEVDVRLIAATHRDLEKAVREGMFREDLYYRLNVVPIFLPSLRERKEDLPLLVEHFLQKFNTQNHKQIKLDPAVVDMLSRYEWPGNVRELENCIERMVVMAAHDTISIEDAARMTHFLFPAIQEQTKVSIKSSKDSLPESLEQIEREQILSTLEKCGWVQARAARLLGMTPRQIAYKMRKYEIPLRPPSNL